MIWWILGWVILVVLIVRFFYVSTNNLAYVTGYMTERSRNHSRKIYGTISEMVVHCY